MSRFAADSVSLVAAASIHGPQPPSKTVNASGYIFGDANVTLFETYSLIRRDS